MQDGNPQTATSGGRSEENQLALRQAFDLLVTPSRPSADAGVRPSLPGNAEVEQRRQNEDAWPAQSRRTRRARAYLTLGKLASGATVLAALEFGSTLGQAIGAAVFGGIDLILDSPDVLKTLRQTRKEPPGPAQHRR